MTDQHPTGTSSHIEPVPCPHGIYDGLPCPYCTDRPMPSWLKPHPPVPCPHGIYDGLPCPYCTDRPMPSWLKPHPPNPRPQRIRVFFCSVCGFACGIEDYDRIRHEHFENDRRCARGVWDIKTYEAIDG